VIYRRLFLGVRGVGLSDHTVLFFLIWDAIAVYDRIVGQVMRIASRGTARRGVAVLAVVLVGLLGGPAWGQSVPSAPTGAAPSPLYAPEAGALPQRYVGPDDYDAHKQNWGAAQDTSGTLYVGNTEGILVYDGHGWRTLQTANRSIVRSVAADAHGRVFVGAQQDFGVLRRDSTGRRRYVSLLDHVSEAERAFSDVWRTGVTETGVYFQSHRRLFRWQPATQSMASWAPPAGTEFGQGNAVRDTFYVGVADRGLMAVAEDSLRLVPGGARFADHTVRSVRPHPTHGLIVGTEDGLFVRDGASFRPLDTAVDDRLAAAWVYKVVVLDDGTLAVSTIDAGLFLLAPDGRLLRRLRPRGRPVTGLYEDREGGLWALLDGGLMRYDLAAPFTEYDLEGAVTDVVRHRGDLYATTLENLYRGTVREDTMAMRSDPAVNTQSWALLSAGRDLLVGTINGLERRGPDGTSRRLFDAEHVYALLRSRHDSTRVYAATGRGVRLVRRTGAGWAPGPWIPGLDTEARTLAEADAGTLWVGTAFDGVYRVRLSDSLDATAVDHFGPDHGLPPDRVDPQRSNGKLVFGTSTGLMRFVEAPAPHFEPMSSVGMPPLERKDGITRLQTLREGEAWGITGWGPGRWRRRDTTWRWAPGPLHRLRGRAVQMVRAAETGEALWFGTERGLLRYVPHAPPPGPPPPTRIQAVRVPEADSVLPIAATSSPSLPYAHNSVTVNYGTPSLAQPSAIEYQYRVPPRSAEWSDWTPRTERELQNLSPGTVTFAVRARTAYGDTTRAARVSVTVLPPWYRTWWAYGLYGLLALGLVGGAVQWRTRQLRRRQEALEETVAERTEQIRQKKDELARQAEELKELDEAKNRFFANLSHEFRTPLTLIRGPVQSVRERLRRTDVALDEEAEQLAVVERNTNRLRRLVDQLLALARLDAGSYELAARPLDLGAETKRIGRSFEPLAEQNDLTLTIETDDAATDEAAPMMVDQEALEHILGNLLSNAIKFTPEGGCIEVTVTETPEHVAVAVADTGPGIPEKRQQRVFERFQRAEESASGDREGIGIGLAFTKDLVDLHGGTVTLNSIEGEGTTITVRFPRGTDHLTDDQVAAPRPADDAESTDSPEGERTPSSTSPSPTLDPRPSSSPSERTAAPGPTPPPEEKWKNDPDDQSQIVLVVDDNADVRRYVRSVLAPDYAVVEAADGEAGLARAREAMPDCILADVMMPAMDGVAMTRHLRQDPTTEGIPVVMLTARAGPEHEIEGLEAGADDYVTKPFDADVLRARVAGMIEVRRRLRRRIREELRRRHGDGSAVGRAEEDRPDGEGAVEEGTGGDRAPETAPPRLVVPTAADDEPDFVRTVRAVIEERLADPDLTVEELAGAVAVSRSTLYRRLKEHVDRTPSQFLRQVRIEHGARLLREREGTISEVAYAVGFDSLSYFSRQFREHVGQSPSEYVEAVG